VAVFRSSAVIPMSGMPERAPGVAAAAKDADRRVTYDTFEPHRLIEAWIVLSLDEVDDDDKDEDKGGKGKDKDD